MNLPESRVLAVLQGEPESIANMKKLCWKGPSLSNVTDIEEQSHPKGSGFDRKERMIALLEEQAQEAVQKGEDNKANEIYTKLLILDPQNEAYRSHLPDSRECSPRWNWQRF